MTLQTLRDELETVIDGWNRSLEIGCQLIDALEYVEKINPALVREARLSAGLAVDDVIPETVPFDIKSNYSRFVMSTTPIVMENVTVDRLNEILEWVYSAGAKAVLRKYRIENV